MRKEIKIRCSEDEYNNIIDKLKDEDGGSFNKRVLHYLLGGDAPVAKKRVKRNTIPLELAYQLNSLTTNLNQLTVLFNMAKKENNLSISESQAINVFALLLEIREKIDGVYNNDIDKMHDISIDPIEPVVIPPKTIKQVKEELDKEFSIDNIDLEKLSKSPILPAQALAESIAPVVDNQKRENGLSDIQTLKMIEESGIMPAVLDELHLRLKVPESRQGVWNDKTGKVDYEYVSKRTGEVSKKSCDLGDYCKRALNQGRFIRDFIDDLQNDFEQAYIKVNGMVNKER